MTLKQTKHWGRCPVGANLVRSLMRQFHWPPRSCAAFSISTQYGTTETRLNKGQTTAESRRERDGRPRKKAAPIFCSPLRPTCWYTTTAVLLALSLSVKKSTHIAHRSSATVLPTSSTLPVYTVPAPVASRWLWHSRGTVRRVYRDTEFRVQHRDCFKLLPYVLEGITPRADVNTKLCEVRKPML